jgi:hypothetical protein
MSTLFNIQAGYALAAYATHVLYDESSAVPRVEEVIDITQDEVVQRLRRPHRHTVLHLFLEGLETMSLTEALHDVSHSEMYSDLLTYARVTRTELPAWFTLKEIDKHPREVIDLFPALVPKVADAAFEILFNDREFLFRFQCSVAQSLEATTKMPDGGVRFGAVALKRCRSIPAWLKRAVFFRDRGICQECARDVSGLLNIANKYHIDHMLPLKAFGTNDPTNFQLLCENCNLRKSAKSIRPHNQQERFWAKDEPIGIGTPLAERPSRTTNRTDRVISGSAATGRMRPAGRPPPSV